MAQFGERLRQLREKKGLLQRHVANQLDMDTPMLSKIERGERNARKEHVPELAKLFEVTEDELMALWLGDRVYNIIKDEKTALEAMQVAEQNIKYHKIKKKK